MAKNNLRLLALSSLSIVACAAGPDGDGPDTDPFLPPSGTSGASADPSGGPGGGPGGGPSGGTTDGDGSETGPGGGEETTGTPPLDPAEAAGGIRVTDVEVNQAVGILVASDGTEVSQRVAPIIGGRDALVRVAYALDPSFSPREIEARIYIGDDAYVDTRSVSGPGDWTNFGGTFSVVVPGERLDSSDDLRVEFVEPGGGATVGTDIGSSFPASGGVDLQVWDDRMVLDVVLVPMYCDGYPSLDLSAENVTNFEAFLFNTYPVQELNLTVHEPVYSSSCSEFDAAEYDLPALRDSEGAAPWVYYGGLLPGNGGGYSISTSGGDQMNYRRTFANHAWRDAGLTSDLFAHELGHNHGREHAFEDPSFPAPTGAWCGPRLTYGWGPRSALMPTSGFSNDVSLGLNWYDPSQNLLTPTDQYCDGAAEGNRYNYNDFMSYTYPFWVGEYTYAALAERVRIISSWNNADVAPPSGKTVRLVNGPDGEMHRIELTGAVPVVGGEQTTADCDGVQVPVRITRSLLEEPTPGGGLDTTELLGYELPLTDDIDPDTCVIAQPTATLSFAAR